MSTEAYSQEDAVALVDKLTGGNNVLDVIFFCPTQQGFILVSTSPGLTGMFVDSYSQLSGLRTRNASTPEESLACAMKCVAEHNQE